MDQGFLMGVLLIFGIIAGTYLYKRNFASHFTRHASRLEDFGQDLTEFARGQGVDPLYGRDREIERTIHILLRRQKNNPLLLGDPGVGKTAIVQGLAQRIVSGNVPPALQKKRVLSLDMNALVADTKLRGELEKRLRDLLETLEREEANVILFIDEIHMLTQMSASGGSLNMSDVFKPALARGELQIIGATTWEEYKGSLQLDGALERRFQPVLVNEPTQKEAIAMLLSLRELYETFHNVTIPDETIVAAVKLSHKKIVGRFLPDKAIDLIDEASAKTAIEATHPAHAKAMGVVYAASKQSKQTKKSPKNTVTVKDIESIVAQWVAQTKEEEKHDARTS